MKHCIADIKAQFDAIYEALLPSGFDRFLADSKNYDQFCEWRDAFYEGDWETKLEVDFAGGCTRFVIIPRSGDYVFKIQYDFDKDIDYCANEAAVYVAAEREGVAEFFAWTACIGTYGNADVYAMERVVVDENRNSSDSYAYHCEQWREESGSDDEDVDIFGDYDDHDGMIEYAIAHNGNLMRKAVDLLESIGVNDLHCGNWGYRDDVFVLVDYGGYGTRLHLD
jgi:hypothetical protein